MGGRGASSGAKGGMAQRGLVVLRAFPNSRLICRHRECVSGQVWKIRILECSEQLPKKY